MLDVSNMIQFKIHIIFKNLTQSSINASFSGKYFMVQALQGHNFNQEEKWTGKTNDNSLSFF